MKNFCKLLLIAILTISTMTMPVYADQMNRASTYLISPRYNNISQILLSLDFDANNVAECKISVIPRENCSGISGMMRLLDANGNLVASWAITDYESPYSVTKYCQCESGKVYTLTFQGYAYGDNGAMFDDFVLETTRRSND